MVSGGIGASGLWWTRVMWSLVDWGDVISGGLRLWSLVREWERKQTAEFWMYCNMLMVDFMYRMLLQ